MIDLLDQLETEARQRARGLEATGKLPNGFVDQHYPLTARELAELRRLKACAVAAADIDTYIAMCKGDIVPTHRLDAGLLAYHRRRAQHRQSPQANGD